MATDGQRPGRRVITSFMLRFVYEAENGEEEFDAPEEMPTEPNSSNWRGVVKHIQSGAEHHFTTLAEAESFIKKYIK